VHCDNCAFPEAAARVASCWKAIGSASDRFSARSLRALGGLLHTTQDFYSHSNWVELHEGMSPLPVWDLDPASLPEGIFSGTMDVEEPRRCVPGAPDHDRLNKDTARSEQGRRTVAAGPNAGKTYFELAFEAAVEASARQAARFVEGVECYRVSTKTGDCLFAGTDAQMFIVLHGGGRDSGRMGLGNVGRNDFERGRTDEFIVGTEARIGEVERVTIGYEAGPEAGALPGWYLEEVTVERTGGGGPRRFRVGRWLARNEGDGKTVVELRAQG